MYVNQATLDRLYKIVLEIIQNPDDFESRLSIDKQPDGSLDIFGDPCSDTSIEITGDSNPATVLNELYLEFCEGSIFEIEVTENGPRLRLDTANRDYVAGCVRSAMEYLCEENDYEVQIRLRYWRDDIEVLTGYTQYDLDHRGVWAYGYLSNGEDPLDVALQLECDLIDELEQALVP